MRSCAESDWLSVMNPILYPSVLVVKTGQSIFTQRLKEKKFRYLKKIPDAALRLTSVITYYVEKPRVHRGWVTGV